MICVLVNSICFNSSFCGWILDLGATDHMNSNLNILFALKDMSKEDIHVNLPNGYSVCVKYILKNIF